eukprot:TRINITY_DN15850_c0_g1_i1.p1 TRINITY_DN15850_c0_g1~~TRINITY_DN15850_c0_g1_i1.p1  ORF type:complete len:68 (-),score=9.64 TRINITY_DN15850_c0_g1_i1:396-599(-)
MKSKSIFGEKNQAIRRNVFVLQNTRHFGRMKRLALSEDNLVVFEEHTIVINSLRNNLKISWKILPRD